MPVQELGTKKQRPLPYEFQITDSVSQRSDGSVRLDLSMANTGAAGAVLYAYDRLPDGTRATLGGPRKYTIEAGKNLTDTWIFRPESASEGRLQYWLSIHGPNGFVRILRGGKEAVAMGLEAGVTFDPVGQQLLLHADVTADVTADVVFEVEDNAYGFGSLAALAVGKTADGGGTRSTHAHRTEGTGNWYDVSVLHRGTGFERRFMGRMETGRTTTTDPAMGHGPPQRTGYGDEAHSHTPPVNGHPLLSEELRQSAMKPWITKDQCASRRAQMKDACWGWDSPLGIFGKSN